MERAGAVTRILLAAGWAGLASGLSGCGGHGGATAPSRLAGGYELRTVQDQPLPYSTSGDPQWGVRYLGGGLTVVGDSLFLYETTDVVLAGEPSTPQTQVRGGRYELSGTRIVVVFSQLVNGQLQTRQDTGTVVGTEIRLAQRRDAAQVDTFLYVRQ